MNVSRNVFELQDQSAQGLHSSNLPMLLDSLRAIAQEGLSYSQNEYDTARYEKLLELASAQYEAITGLAKEEIRDLFLREQGSITPKLSADCAVRNDKGEVLALRRKGDGTWGTPGGWADVGESPFETAERETYEETGLVVSAIGYIAITHKTPLTHPGFVSQVAVCVAVKPISSSQKVILSQEHTDYRWINSPEQVGDWHSGQWPLISKIFDAYRKDLFIPSGNY